MTKKALLLLNPQAGKNTMKHHLLGKFCFRGEHTEKDVFEAERLLNASAEQKKQSGTISPCKIVSL